MFWACHLAEDARGRIVVSYEVAGSVRLIEMLRVMV